MLDNSEGGGGKRGVQTNVGDGSQVDLEYLCK